MDSSDDTTAIAFAEAEKLYVHGTDEYWLAVGGIYQAFTDGERDSLKLQAAGRKAASGPRVIKNPAKNF